MDFSLLEPNSNFEFEPYFDAIRTEFQSLGFEVDIESKRKAASTGIESAFLKKTASQYDVQVRGERVLKIKLEVDTDPPLGFETEQKLLLQPHSFYVRCFTLPDLFAGKVHALLFRPWKNRVKGRDWYDFEWYARSGIALNRSHLTIRALQSGHLTDAEEAMSKTGLRTLLLNKIDGLEVNLAKEDVMRFLRDPDQLQIWSTDYFKELANRVVNLSENE